MKITKNGVGICFFGGKTHLVHDTKVVGPLSNFPKSHLVIMVSICPVDLESTVDPGSGYIVQIVFLTGVSIWSPLSI